MQLSRLDCRLSTRQIVCQEVARAVGGTVVIEAAVEQVMRSGSREVM